MQCLAVHAYSDYIFWYYVHAIQHLSRSFHCTGNLTTLKKTPKKKGIDVVEHLKRFHRDYYSASYMTAVLVSEGVTILEQLSSSCAVLLVDRLT